uniref:AMP-activated protein kinase glycogen-binding domain-containing protein n=1 Tax=uncultured bacterium contig00101 TaxID=1181568 RepID=A0A806KL44_9BACT|nr:hypothetical protein [uncultured bacterium contig00101]
MKAYIAAALLIFIIGNIWAVDIDSYQFIDYLRAISEPRRPEIYGDGVLFTASDSLKRVGVSFAHENYTKIHWFKRLRIPRDQSELVVNGKVQKKMDPNQDTGILFHFEPIPDSIKNMDYRMIIEGLWTADPLNPVAVLGPFGVVESRISLPEKPPPYIAATAPGTYNFSYRAPPEEIVTVGGSFNNWDPFMYKLRETSPGFYTLSLPLPQGVFQYVFFHRGEWIPDPANTRNRYSRDGRVVSEALVER